MDFQTDTNGIQTLTATPTGAAGLAINGNFSTLSTLITTANTAIANANTAITALNSALSTLTTSDAAKLPLSGGTMSGNLNLGNNDILNASGLAIGGNALDTGVSTIILHPDGSADFAAGPDEDYPLITLHANGIINCQGIQPAGGFTVLQNTYLVFGTPGPYGYSNESAFMQMSTDGVFRVNTYSYVPSVEIDAGALSLQANSHNNVFINALTDDGSNASLQVNGSISLNNGVGELLTDFYSGVSGDGNGNLYLWGTSLNLESNIGFYGASPVSQQPSGGEATAGSTYGTLEQSMINAMYSALRNYGLLA